MLKIKGFFSRKKNEIVKEYFLLDGKSHFNAKEAYKMLRVNLLYTLAAKNLKTIVVTSSSSNEGKSTVTANIANTFAENGSKVLIIDADLRKPVQHNFFKVDNSLGLSNILLNKKNEIKLINISENLDLLTAGPVPPNPSELLGCDAMKELMKYLKSKYDFIILDTPPINVVSDTKVLLDDSVGALLVAKQKQTTNKELKKAVEQINMTDSGILGIVLNAVDNKNKEYYYEDW